MLQLPVEIARRLILAVILKDHVVGAFNSANKIVVEIWNTREEVVHRMHSDDPQVQVVFLNHVRNRFRVRI